MERLKITAEARQSGKGIAHRLREDKKVPAVLYGRVEKPLNLTVNAHELETITSTDRGVNVVVDLEVKGDKTHLVFIRDFQADVLTRKFTHVDFQAVDKSDKIKIEIPVKLIGKPVGVKEGGILDQIRHTVQICSLPDRIPVHIDVDVTALNIGDNIHVNDITVPEGIEVIRKTNFTIATVVPPPKIEEVVAAPVAEGAEAAPGAAAPAEGEKAAAPAEGAPAEGEKKEKAGKEKAPAKDKAKG